MANNVRLRIVKKTKDGVILDMKQFGKQAFPWNEFNKIYEIVDNVYAQFNADYLAKNEEADKYIDDACVAYFFINGPGVDAGTKLTYMAMLGDCVEKAGKILNLNNLDVMKIIRQRIDAVRNFGSTPKRSSKHSNRHSPHKTASKVNDQPERAMNTVFADNEALMKLKESMEK